MASRRSKQPLARVVSDVEIACIFCQRKVDDEITYGKLYAIGDIRCHYFCVLLSSCLIQKGKDDEGLFGFLYSDILLEVERSKKHRCSYCGKGGATLGCCISQCRKQFHLPCGRERQAISLFYGNYKSYCQLHAPKQKVADNIMAKANQRMLANRKKCSKSTNIAKVDDNGEELKEEKETVCVICYERVDGYPTLASFWPPCCARDAWFHRSCLQRMALSAGMHYLKCPLCNDKEHFYEAVVDQGYYVPDRDAAWELEQNAFAEIYERPLSCGAGECRCPMGRNHDAETGMWDIKLCMLCGSVGVHAHCLAPDSNAGRFVCRTCAPVAPQDIELLATTIDALIQSEEHQASTSRRSGPVMPSRMSLRRTKQRMLAQNAASTSQRFRDVNKETNIEAQQQDNTTTSRLDLNLKQPRKPTRTTDSTREADNNLLSPMKLVEKSLYERMSQIKGNGVDLSEIVEKVRTKFLKPKPLSEKKRLINELLEDIFDNMLQENKSKETVKEWCSPRKLNDIKEQAIEKTQETEIKDEFTANITPTFEVTETNVEDLNEDITSDICNITNASDVNIENDGTKEKDIEDIQIKDKNKRLDVNEADIKTPSNLKLEFEPNNLLHFDTPKSKTVEIENDSSLEISENDEIVNIDLQKVAETETTEIIKNLYIKVPTATNKCSFKFSPNNKENLEKDNVDIDMETFKNQYLNEVDRDYNFKCNYDHKHRTKKNSNQKLRTALDFAMDAHKANGSKLKRKIAKDKDVVVRKKRKIPKKKDIVEIEVDERKKSRKKIKTRVSIGKNDIRLKIKFKKKQVDLKIQSKLKRKKEKAKKTMVYKQCVLQCSPESKELIVKPDYVSPQRRKYNKTEKKQDSLVQTSIQSFFQLKSPISPKGD